MRHVEFTNSAKADFVAAFSWYEGRQPGLGESFRRSIEALLSLIARRPDGFPRVDERFRRAVVRRYPYVLVFDFDSERCIVHAVFHTAMQPSRLHARLRNINKK